MRDIVGLGLVTVPLVAASSNQDATNVVSNPKEGGQEGSVERSFADNLRSYFEGLSKNLKPDATMKEFQRPKFSITAGDVVDNANVLVDLATFWIGEHGIKAFPAKSKDTEFQLDVKRKNKKLVHSFATEKATARVTATNAGWSTQGYDLHFFMRHSNTGLFCSRLVSKFADYEHLPKKEDPKKEEAKPEETKKEEGGQQDDVQEKLLELGSSDDVKQDVNQDDGGNPIQETNTNQDANEPASEMVTGKNGYDNFKSLLEARVGQDWSDKFVEAIDAIREAFCEKTEKTEEGKEPTLVWTGRSKQKNTKELTKGNSAISAEASFLRQQILNTFTKPYRANVQQLGGNSSADELLQANQKISDLQKDLQFKNNEFHRVKGELAAKEGKTYEPKDHENTTVDLCPEKADLVTLSKGKQDTKPVFTSDIASDVYNLFGDSSSDDNCKTCAIIAWVLAIIGPIAVAALFILRSSASDDDQGKDDEDEDAE